MRHLLSLILCCVAAAPAAALQCSVLVEYRHDGTLMTTYQRDFEVTPDLAYADDFSTPTRMGQFSASAVKQGTATRVSFDYFADVDTFDAMAFDNQLVVPPTRRGASVSGSQDFFTSLGVTGRHRLTHTLSCR